MSRRFRGAVRGGFAEGSGEPARSRRELQRGGDCPGRRLRAHARRSRSDGRGVVRDAGLSNEANLLVVVYAYRDPREFRVEGKQTPEAPL